MHNNVILTLPKMVSIIFKILTYILGTLFMPADLRNVSKKYKVDKEFWNVLANFL